MKRLYSKTNIFIFSFGFLFFIFLSGCQTAESTRELSDVYYDLGNAYSKLGRSEAARKAFQRAFILSPTLVKAAYNLGKMDIEAGRYTEGIGIFRTLLKKNPDNILVREALAWGFYKKGDKEKSLSVYQGILGIDTVNKNALHNICVLLISEERYTDAYPYLKQAESLGDADFFIYEQLGISESKLGVSSGTYWLEKAKSIKPDNVEILNLLASAYTKEKNYTEALKDYDLILSKGKDPEILFKKAFLLLTKIEDYDTGLKILQEALQAGFSDKSRLEKLSKYPDLLYKERIDKIIDDFSSQSP